MTVPVVAAEATAHPEGLRTWLPRKALLKVLAARTMIGLGDFRDSEIRAVGAAAAEAITAGRVIIMGLMPDAVVRRQSPAGGALLDAGRIGHPFRKPWILAHDWKGDERTTWPTSRRDPRDLPDAFRGGTTTAIYVVIPHPETPSRFMICECIAYEHGPRRGLIAAALVECRGPREMRLREHMDMANMHTDHEAVTSICNSAREPVLAALALLNTRGVRSEDRAAKHHGKDLAAPAHHRILTDDYVTSLKGERLPPPAGPTEGQAACHASPIPHLRRGHIRHLPDGRETWVRDCLVNCAGEGGLAFAERHRAAYVAPEDRHAH